MLYVGPHLMAEFGGGIGGGGFNNSGSPAAHLVRLQKAPAESERNWIR